MKEKYVRSVMPALCAMASLQIPTQSVAAEAARIEVPIKQTILPNGQLRYSIVVTVNDMQVETWLDSGSIGLRLLPSALPTGTLKREKAVSVYSYASGVQLSGPFAKATITIGGQASKKTVYVHAVETIQCVERKPNCPASRVSIEDYRIGGDEFPGQGFKAIIGTGLRPSGVPNPLESIGDGVWIINLPRPGEDTPGTLILNPDEDERAGYTMYRLQREQASTPVGRVTGWQDAIPSCLIDTDGNKSSVCALSLLDTGQPGFKIVSDKPADLASWTPGTRAAIVFKGEGDSLLSASFITNRQPGGGVSTEARAGKQADGIRAGTLPYYAFSVLYDSKAGKIGLRARETN